MENNGGKNLDVLRKYISSSKKGQRKKLELVKNGILGD